MYIDSCEEDERFVVHDYEAGIVVRLCVSCRRGTGSFCILFLKLQATVRFTAALFFSAYRTRKIVK